ncbi:Lung seven transmembrane receptor-like [Trema orientale]|uniref:Lung seven transmembrane receptor-like n=1 Tax=Trema orientale TaxID=63057 RepID=A0A2P5BMN5_TREOI|nr:Lung seven transmembrane receptor-like [Trema orientale]
MGYGVVRPTLGGLTSKVILLGVTYFLATELLNITEYVGTINDISGRVYFKATDPFNERWQSAWIITAFWDILAFALLCVICYLWAPSQSSQRYAYSEEVGEDSDDEEAQSLTRGKSDGDLSLVKQEKKEKKARDEENYDEEDNSEEDKRE